MNMTCKKCNGTGAYMYQMNEGIYCENCKDVGLEMQKNALKMAEYEDRARYF